ncbi:MAG: radical SAM family heme chaperone HemW [Anaerolineaceae bacterium]|nr:radical SAM family heme chaperone HemW [Anaerolineaceae bacterium]
MDALSVYLHIPFCRTRCSYCDFFTCAGQEAAIPAYAAALCREAELWSQAAGRRLPVHSLYFGGGTPSLLPVEYLTQIIIPRRGILDTLSAAFDLAGDCEVSLEANPGTLSRQTLANLHSAGINRLSLGVQSSDATILRLLGRQHTYPEVIEAVGMARVEGFNNLNLDLIYGVPTQTLAMWQRTLEDAILLNPEHLSLYSLTLEPGTRLHAWVGHGLVPAPDADLAADMYEWANERLTEAGYHRYEISNWARRGKDGALLACWHNLQYWRNLPYLGLGAGAHGYVGGYRLANIAEIGSYIARCAQPVEAQFPAGPATEHATTIDKRTEMQETMMVGLRLTEAGVGRQEFRERFGVELDQVFAPEITQLTRQGLLEWVEDRLRLTQRGCLLGNQVFLHFVDG